MERIRIGNNIAISWAVYDLNGRIHNLEGKDIQLYMAVGGYKVYVNSYTIQGNVISWVFLGSEQTKTGDYKLVLEETDPLSGASTFGVRAAFRLTPEDVVGPDIVLGPANVSVQSVLTYSNLVGVESIDVVESSEDSGDNIVTIHLIDGSFAEVVIKNGSKGPKGDKGDTGATGPKGEKGDTGERGPVGVDTVNAAIGTNDPSQAPSVDKTFADGVLGLTFNNIKGAKGDKGDQGNTGSSVDYPYELVNNVTTDDATKGLSAAQGVVLDGKISQLGQYINNDEWLYVATDSNGKILFGLKTDGSFYINKAAFLDMLNRLNISALEGVTLFNNEEWLNVETDKNGNLLSGTKKDGSHYIHNVKSETLPDFCYADSQEWLLLLLEARNRLLCGIKKDGTFETKKINTKELYVSSDNGLYNFLTTASKNKYNKEILSLHPETEIVPILRNYKFWGYQYNNTHPDYKPLTLLWFTDLHKDSDNLSRISKFFSTYKSSGIDDVIFTGDATDDYTDSISFWGKNGGKSILFCVGNHEVCIGSTFVSPKQAYDKYLAPNIENWDAETNENKCYWYKDYSFPYSEECPSGIRIISLDMYHWKETTNYDGTPLSGDSYADGTPYDTGEQESWFIDVLDNAKENGFAVIVLVHGPKNDIDELSCSFNTLDKITLNARECFKDDMLQDVADFIEAGGEFVCWLCGHTHQDWFGTIEGQPLIVAGTSSHITKWRGDDMVVGTKSQDRFNLISIEPVKKYIRIHRVGLEYDRHGRYINEIVYDYQNKTLISNL